MSQDESHYRTPMHSDALDLPTIVRQLLGDLDDSIEHERRFLEAKQAAGLTVMFVNADGQLRIWPDGDVVEEDYYATYGRIQGKSWPRNWYNREWVWDEIRPARTSFHQVPASLNEVIYDWVMDHPTEAQLWLSQRAVRRAESSESSD